LLLGEFARAGLSRIEIAVKLLATPDEVRGRFGEFEPSIAFAHPLAHPSPLNNPDALSGAPWRDVPVNPGQRTLLNIMPGVCASLKRVLRAGVQTEIALTDWFD
jgi:hypothetical protein